MKNLEELKAQFPDLYASAIQAGIEQHKDLVLAHLTMGEAGNCIDLAIKNIKEDKKISASVNAEYMAEGMKKKDIKDRIEDDPDGSAGTGTDSGDDEAEQKAYEAKLKAKMGVKK